MKTYTYSPHNHDQLPPYWWLNPWSHVRRLKAAVVAIRELGEKIERDRDNAFIAIREHLDTIDRWQEKALSIERDNESLRRTVVYHSDRAADLEQSLNRLTAKTKVKPKAKKKGVRRA